MAGCALNLSLSGRGRFAALFAANRVRVKSLYRPIVSFAHTTIRPSPVTGQKAGPCRPLPKRERLDGSPTHPHPAHRAGVAAAHTRHRPAAVATEGASAMPAHPSTSVTNGVPHKHNGTDITRPWVDAPYSLSRDMITGSVTP